MDIRISPCRMLHGRIEVPGDKSVSHRAVMLGALSEGITEISGFLMSADCLSTISCFEKMGVRVDRNDAEKTVTVEGRSLHGLRAPSELLYTGNSGTTTRIISGILAGQSFESTLDGDSSIRWRPMKRIIDPLLAMGASVRSEKENGCVPLRIRGGSLHGICWRSPVASAQVKSGILLAGLYADSETSVLEPALSRNHTELMLKAFKSVNDVKEVPGTAPENCGYCRMHNLEMAKWYANEFAAYLEGNADNSTIFEYPKTERLVTEDGQHFYDS